jgi:hypothetical protein
MKKTSFRPAVEGLETRCVPTTAKLSGHLLAITGTHGKDHITIHRSGANITVSGVHHFFHAASVTKIGINGKGGNDVVAIDKRLTMPVVVIAAPGKEIVVAGGGHVSVQGRGHVTILHNPPASRGRVGTPSPGLGLVGNPSPGLGLVGNPSPGLGLVGNPITFASVNITPYEQLMLELLNRARANPTGEASRYGINLNEGIMTSTTAALVQPFRAAQVKSSGAISGPISSTPKQPLAPNAALYTAAVQHSQDMLTRNYFDHPTLGTGISPSQRDINAGYDGYSFGENIGERGTTGTLDQVQSVFDVHRDLFVDSSEPGRGHRINMMDPDFNEVGVGIRYGPYSQLISGVMRVTNAIMVTQDFGGGDNRVYLTGVMYHDGNGNQFYDVGEGKQGVQIKATSQKTGQIYITTTGTSGGYEMPLPAGTYSVTWTGMTGSARTETIGTPNAKLDMLM